MVKRQLELPTTVALLVGRRQNGSVSAAAIWAGDSHVYALSASRGLQLLTRDDFPSGDTDPQYLKIAVSPTGDFVDRPIKNLAHAGSEWHLYDLAYTLDDCLLAFVATDGVYTCGKGPREFEQLLLDLIANTEGPEEFRTALSNYMEKHRQDDATLALATFEDDWSKVQLAATDRLSLVEATRAGDHEYLRRYLCKPLVSEPKKAPAAEAVPRVSRPTRPQQLETTMGSAGPSSDRHRNGSQRRGISSWALNAGAVVVLGAAVYWAMAPSELKDVNWTQREFDRRVPVDCGGNAGAKETGRTVRGGARRSQADCMRLVRDEICAEAKVNVKLNRCRQELEGRAYGHLWTEEGGRAEFVRAYQKNCAGQRSWVNLKACLDQQAARVCRDVPTTKGCPDTLAASIRALIGDAPPPSRDSVIAFDCKNPDFANTAECRDRPERVCVERGIEPRSTECKTLIERGTSALPPRDFGWAVNEMKTPAANDCRKLLRMFTVRVSPESKCLMTAASRICDKITAQKPSGCAHALVKAVAPDQLNTKSASPDRQ